MQYFKIFLIFLLSFPIMAQHGQYIKGFDCPTCTKTDEDETITGSWDFTNGLKVNEIMSSTYNYITIKPNHFLYPERYLRLVDGNTGLSYICSYNGIDYNIFNIATDTDCSNGYVLVNENLEITKNLKTPLITGSVDLVLQNSINDGGRTHIGKLAIDGTSLSTICTKTNPDESKVLLSQYYNDNCSTAYTQLDTRLIANSTLNNTGNEVAYQLNYETDKSSGNDTGLEINMTDTSTPGTSYLINAKVDGTSVFYVENNGKVSANYYNANNYYTLNDGDALFIKGNYLGKDMVGIVNNTENAIGLYIYGTHPANVVDIDTYNDLSNTLAKLLSVRTNQQDRFLVYAKGGISIADAGTRPICNSLRRGLIWNDEGSTGYSDMLSICVKESDDTYRWQELYSEQYDPDGWDGKNEMNCRSTGICHEYYQNSFPYSWYNNDAPNTIEWKGGYYSFGHTGALTAFAYYNVGNISGDFELRGKISGKGRAAKAMIFVATSSGDGYAIGRGETYKGVQRATLSSWTPTYSDENTYYSIYYFKIIRTGSDIYHYYSENGIEWTKWGYASDSTTFNYIGWLIYIPDEYTTVSIDWLRFKQ